MPGHSRMVVLFFCAEVAVLTYSHVFSCTRTRHPRSRTRMCSSRHSPDVRTLPSPRPSLMHACTPLPRTPVHSSSIDAHASPGASPRRTRPAALTRPGAPAAHGRTPAPAPRARGAHARTLARRRAHLVVLDEYSREDAPRRRTRPAGTARGTRRRRPPPARPWACAARRAGGRAGAAGPPPPPTRPQRASKSAKPAGMAAARRAARARTQKLDRAHLLGVALLPMCSLPRLRAPVRRYPPPLLSPPLRAPSRFFPRRRKVYSTAALPRCRRRDPPYYVPEGDSPLSLQATAQLSRAVVSASASKHRAGVRATIQEEGLIELSITNDRRSNDPEGPALVSAQSLCMDDADARVIVTRRSGRGRSAPRARAVSVV